MANIKIYKSHPMDFCTSFINFTDINVSFFYLQKQVKVTEYNFCNDAIRLQIAKSIKVVQCIFLLALTISEILTFQMFDLLKLGQGHGV